MQWLVNSNYIFVSHSEFRREKHLFSVILQEFCFSKWVVFKDICMFLKSDYTADSGLFSSSSSAFSSILLITSTFADGYVFCF